MAQWIEVDFPRPDPELIRAIGKFPTGILGDCMNRFYGMDAAIKPLSAGRRICGPAFTIQSMESSNWGAHQALALAKPGDVLVISCRASTAGAAWGYVMTKAAKNARLGGAVIDGCIRDSEENREDDFPLFCRGVCPGGPHKGWPGNLNVAISCAGVPVLPGDIVVGDDDGVVVVPQARAQQVLEEAQKRKAGEDEWFRRLDEGVTTLELLGLDPIKKTD